MQISYSKSLGRYLLILSIALVFPFVTVLIEATPLFRSEASVASYVAPVFFLANLIVGFLLYRAYRKQSDPAKVAKHIGRFLTFFTPVLVLVMVVMSVAFPNTAIGNLKTHEPQPYFYVNLSLTGLAFVLSLFVFTRFQKAFKTGDSGLIGYRNYLFVGMVFMSLVFLYYLCGVLKLINFDIIAFLSALVGPKGDGTDVNYDALAVTIPVHYFILSGFQMVLAIASFFLVLYSGLTSWISGIEKQAMDFRSNADFAKRLAKKYDIPFWFGILVSFLLMILALVPVFTTGSTASLTLAFLHFSVIAIRIPTYFWKRNIDKKNAGDYNRLWIEEHRMLIYGGIAIILFVVISFAFGSASGTKEGANMGVFVTYAIFVPWALVKAYLGTRKYLTASKTGSPYQMLHGYLDIMLALFTFANTLYMIGNSTDFPFAMSAGKIFSIVLIVYGIYVAIRIFVIGLLGVMGKRKTAFRHHRQKLAQALGVLLQLPEDQQPTPEEIALTNTENWRVSVSALYMISVLEAGLYLLTSLAFLYLCIVLALDPKAIDAFVQYFIKDSTYTRQEIEAAIRSVMLLLGVISIIGTVVYLTSVVFIILGSNSLQYGKRRKWLHILNIVMSVLTLQPLLLPSAILALVAENKVAKEMVHQTQQHGSKGELEGQGAESRKA